VRRIELHAAFIFGNCGVIRWNEMKSRPARANDDKVL